MNAALSLTTNRYFIVAGWAALLILWQSTGMAIMLACWRLAKPQQSPEAQYKAAIVAFGVAILLSLAIPIALLRAHPGTSLVAFTTDSAPAAGSASANPSSSKPAVLPSVVSVFFGGPKAVPTHSINAFAGWGGLLWSVGVLVLAVRLLGGWWLAAWIAGRALPVTGRVEPETVRRLRNHLGVAVPVSLRQSSHVEAPVVIGWRRPSLVLPSDIAQHLTPDALEPLLAHEFAHIRRRDYLANLIQSMTEVVLFFSPGVQWISRRIREAREYCCDDIAVSTCGDRRRYINALTMLASLGAVNRARPVIGAAGPRLILRVRRLLKENTMPKFANARLAGLTVALLALAITGSAALTVSAEQTSQLPFGPTLRDPQVTIDKIPYGYVMEQPGAAVTMEDASRSPDGHGFVVTVKNNASEAVVGLSFIAIIERKNPLRFLNSDLLSTFIAPGATAQVLSPVLSSEQLQDIVQATNEPLNCKAPGRGAGGPAPCLQVFLGLLKVRFANGHEWEVTPNPNSRDGADALSLPRPDIPRELVTNTPSDDPLLKGKACRDDQEHNFSRGAMVPIRREPGHFVRCENGQWVENTR